MVGAGIVLGGLPVAILATMATTLQRSIITYNPYQGTGDLVTADDDRWIVRVLEDCAVTTILQPLIITICCTTEAC